VELRELIGLGGFIVLFILLVVRAPVGLAMVAVGIGGNFALSLAVPHLRFEPFLRQFKSLLWNVVANYDLSVVPLFVLMGLLASHANLSRDLFRGLNAIVGRFRGGVAMAAIGACAGFGAVCGSSLATASTMGRVALPELRRLNYSPSLATGALAAGGTLGILIPPSVALVVYAVVVEASIVKLFQAAVIPGLLAVLFFILVIAIQVRINPALAPQVEKQKETERRAALLRLIPVGVIFGAIILGLGFGLFTPTPAAAVGVFVILAYGLLQRLWGEGLTIGGIRHALLDSAVTSGMIYFILFGAEVLKSFFARSGLPAAMAEWAANSGVEPFMLLAGILIVLIILGCFLESLSMILVIVPFLWPILMEVNGGEFVIAAEAAYGLDQESLRLWFGILALIVVELGLITPPVGLNVFIISSLSQGVPMSQTFKGVLPFFAAEIVRVSMIVAFPALSLFLPWLLSAGP
jgi:tripartite ATP-independent transporter DctM subunit